MNEPKIEEDEDLYSAATKFVRWLDGRVTASGRGDLINELVFEPSGSFWLGRLAPEEAVVQLGQGDRGERLDPCAIGITVIPAINSPWQFLARVRASVWVRLDDHKWHKSPPIEELVAIKVDAVPGFHVFGASQLGAALTAAAGVNRFASEVRVEVEDHPKRGMLITVMLINTSAKDDPVHRDGNLYETQMALIGLSTRPFTLEALPDSFRYDRKVPAYGLNCGVETSFDELVTTDSVVTETCRPEYWASQIAAPDLTFKKLSKDPLPSLVDLLNAAKEWGNDQWSDIALDSRAVTDLWTTAMSEQARNARGEFEAEFRRMTHGLENLTKDPELLLSFQLMNRAMEHSSRGKYDSWRPFQIGFLLANLDSLVTPEEAAETVDIVWFATGGGKTETYLGLLVMSALLDRLRGKTCGITAWSRFPLRMLSLQQTQRFADALAGAEIARLEAEIGGDPFAVGFLVGREATPNRIPVESKDGRQPDPDDDDMPDLYKVLLYCPFCFSPELEMRFDRRHWRLSHCCLSDQCPWPSESLPFFVVDEEIYRFLPTVVVGTLDKAASLSFQAAMRGLVGPPHGLCSEAGHGFLYSPRTDRANGCLVPGCHGNATHLPMPPEQFGPRFRLQDELHLLRDSLGAVDAHYESLADHLQTQLGSKPKILASSATLSGYERQVDALYNRKARVFPVQGPQSRSSFWSRETNRLARRFVAMAPRGVTLEYVTDRLLTELQEAVRLLVADPQKACGEIGVSTEWADELASIYGVNIVYGNSLRDLDAVTRSLEGQQVQVSPLGFDSLTGRTPFKEVRRILDRLNEPEADFDDRLHVITASSMMSHGVDIDRLNVMVMLGLPLATAEFIQTTARVGRAWPGLVIVLHKIARERDASVFRFFPQFVTHGDRFVEPVPITRRSRRVLDRTVAGLVLARILQLHEPSSGNALTTVGRVRQYFTSAGVTEAVELREMVSLLGLDDPMDELLKHDLEAWLSLFFRNLDDPGGTFVRPKDLSPTGDAMISLRDVEELVPIRESQI